MPIPILSKLLARNRLNRTLRAVRKEGERVSDLVDRVDKAKSAGEEVLTKAEVEALEEKIDDALESLCEGAGSRRRGGGGGAGGGGSAVEARAKKVCRERLGLKATGSPGARAKELEDCVQQELGK